MKNLKKLILIAGFTLLAACGKPPSEKFVGEWIDPTPKTEPRVIYGTKFEYEPQHATIKASSSDTVEVMRVISEREIKHVYPVENNNILDDGLVIYTLEGDELVDSNGLRLYRKK